MTQPARILQAQMSVITTVSLSTEPEGFAMICGPHLMKAWDLIWVRVHDCMCTAPSGTTEHSRRSDESVPERYSGM